MSSPMRPRFQLTRPRGARPTSISWISPLFVSTHAPARGATGVEVGVGHDARQVSTHAPARGATWRGRYPRVGYRFNSRAREGRDRRVSFQLTRPRGARHDSGRKRLEAVLFQLTRPRGARRAAASATPSRSRVSTHAPARGATTRRRSRHVCTSCFNSRAREGRDLPLDDQLALHRCFNSRAREGRDRCFGAIRATFSTFQLTRPRGARR